MEDLIITEEAEEVVDDDTTEEIGGMSAGVLESEVETVDVEELLENPSANAEAIMGPTISQLASRILGSMFPK